MRKEQVKNVLFAKKEDLIIQKYVQKAADLMLRALCIQMMVSLGSI